jgi:hypothetical protein
VNKDDNFFYTLETFLNPRFSFGQGLFRKLESEKRQGRTMAQQTFKNGARESVTTVASSQVKATQQSYNASTLELLSTAPNARCTNELLSRAVVAAARNCLNAPTLLRQFAQLATPLESALAGLFRANSLRVAAGLRTLTAALHSAQSMPPTVAEKFLTRLGLHLIAGECESVIDPSSARRLLSLAGLEEVGEIRDAAALALAHDHAYRVDFQAQVVATAIQAGQMVKAEQPEGAISLRARLGYAGPRQRRAATHRPRAAVRAAQRALAVVAAQ